MSKKQTFRGKEIEALLASAARLQEQEGGFAADGLGLSLEEIEAIASESGIDPEFVRRAALVQNSDVDDEDGFFFMGGPGVVRRRMVLNRRLSAAEMERLVPAFRRIMENEGTTDSLQESLSWRTNERKNAGGTSVVLEADGDRTVCTLKASLWFPGFLIHYVPLMLTLLIALPIGGQALFSGPALAIKLAALALVFLGTRFGYSKFYEKNRKQLDQIQAVIEAAAQAPGELQSPQRAAVKSTTSDADSGRIEIEDEDVRSGGQSEAQRRDRSAE